ncbi:Zinc fingers and homeoboxes protein 2 [Labeo rohita]|uniref:Zinc fingers and homeoboxes protein 2 n=1 Tax=Labeo rohita TaxID=84645 RepID=A0ABQ8L4K0_LABRO|nr:Zinc fingers and homeoboxes protein 2 [Labeo rohita]
MLQCQHNLDKEFFEHLWRHLKKNNETIIFVFTNCSFSTNIYGTFASHRSRKHTPHSLQDFKGDLLKRNCNCEIDESVSDMVTELCDPNPFTSVLSSGGPLSSAYKRRLTTYIENQKDIRNLILQDREAQKNGYKTVLEPLLKHLVSLEVEGLHVPAKGKRVKGTSDKTDAPQQVPLNFIIEKAVQAKFPGETHIQIANNVCCMGTKYCN